MSGAIALFRFAGMGYDHNCAIAEDSELSQLTPHNRHLAVIDFIQAVHLDQRIDNQEGNVLPLDNPQ